MRGELVMRNDEFERLRATSAAEALPANPRNAVAGMVRAGVFRGARVDFVAYAVPAHGWVATHSELREALKGMGFQVCEYGERHANSAAALESARRWMTGSTRQSAWPSDGLVFKVEDCAKAASLGTTRHHPRAMVAFKWSTGNAAQSVIREIEWSADGRGYARPVARFDPVTVDGAVLERASVYHWEYVSRHGLGPGSRVAVERAGGVIPRITPLDAPSATNPVSPPAHCSCELESPLLVEGQHLRCSLHAQCPQRIAYRASQLAEILGIPGIGPAVSRRLQREGLLDASSDWSLLGLTETAMIERGWTEASSKRICDAIASAVGRATFVDVLVMLPVPAMGVASWTDVAKRFPSWDALRRATEEQLALVPGVGPGRAKAVVDLLKEQGEAIAKDLARFRLPQEHQQQHPSNNNSNDGSHFPLEGKRISITGRLSRPRAEIAAALRKQGASVTSSLSSKTSYLLCGADPSLDDVSKAAKLGIATLTESELSALTAAKQ